MNDSKDMLEHIQEEEKLLSMSLAESRRAKKERLEREQHKEWIRQQKLSCHNQD
tara:strand:- start:2199 stop:2360 length:162 start_codon:yes stop_codon:yes gene_type:complete